MNQLVLCKCGEVISKSFNGTTKVRSKVVIFKGSKCYVVCKGCGSELQVPIHIDRDEFSKYGLGNPKLLVYDKDVVILDMEAGVEHLSRGTSRSVNLMLIVVEPAPASLKTAGSIRDLAGDLNIENIAVVGNKIRSEQDKEIIQRELPDFKVIGFLPYDPDTVEAEFRGLAPADTDSAMKRQIDELYNNIRATYEK